MGYISSHDLSLAASGLIIYLREDEFLLVLAVKGYWSPFNHVFSLVGMDLAVWRARFQGWRDILRNHALIETFNHQLGTSPNNYHVLFMNLLD